MSDKINARSTTSDKRLPEPGGYLQWNEVDWGNDVYIGLEENGITQEDSGVHKMRALGLSFLGRMTWPAQMAELAKAQGLENIVFERRTQENLPRQYLRFWTEGIVAASIDATAKMPEGEVRDEFARFTEEASEDAKKGIAWAGDHMVVVGQKPM